MGHPDPKFPADTIKFILPRLNEIERNVDTLTRLAHLPASQLRPAAYNLLASLKETAGLGVEWVPRLYSDIYSDPSRRHIEYGAKLPHSMNIVGERVEDIQFLFRLGDRIYDGLSKQGLLWPPPFMRPPPAITRDLIELHEASRSYSRMFEPFDSGVAERLVQTFRLIGQKSSYLIDVMILEDQRSDKVVNLTRIAAAHSSHGTRPRLSTILSGLALAISLLQGPGAIHDFPDDVRELGGDVIQLARAITTGIIELAEEVERALPRQVD